MKGKLEHNVSLTKYTSWWAGGCARQLYKPENLADLAVFLQQLPADEPLLWLGLGSNVLVRDGGFVGTVIITQGALNIIEPKAQTMMRAEAGIACPKFARHCARLGLTGMEFWVGIPGTVGGALRMNAGAFGGETWEYVAAVETIDRCGEIRVRQPEEFKINYRCVETPITEHDEWFVAGHFRLQSGDRKQSLATIKTLLGKRSNSQPIGTHSCGSVFRNPPNDYAARLIEQAGLKGTSIGDATISTKHANFIINHGNATASDIEELILLAQQTVQDKFKVTLIPEVHIIGDKHQRGNR